MKISGLLYEPTQDNVNTIQDVAVKQGVKLIPFRNINNVLYLTVEGSRDTIVTYLDDIDNTGIHFDAFIDPRWSM